MSFPDGERTKLRDLAGGRCHLCGMPIDYNRRVSAPHAAHIVSTKDNGPRSYRDLDERTIEASPLSVREPLREAKKTQSGLNKQWNGLWCHVECHTLIDPKGSAWSADLLLHLRALRDSISMCIETGVFDSHGEIWTPISGVNHASRLRAFLAAANQELAGGHVPGAVCDLISAAVLAFLYDPDVGSIIGRGLIEQARLLMMHERIANDEPLRKTLQAALLINQLRLDLHQPLASHWGDSATNLQQSTEAFLWQFDEAAAPDLPKLAVVYGAALRSSSAPPFKSASTTSRVLVDPRFIGSAELQTPFWTALLETGARYGELRQATWGDLNFDRGELLLRSENTKSRKQRTIPLRPEAVEALRRLRTLHQRVYGRLATVTDPIYLSPNGKPWGPYTTNAMRVLDRVLERAGIPKVSARGEKLDIHALRHSAATRFLRNHAGLAQTQRLLGHSDPKLTAATYGHLETDDLRDAVEALPTLRPVPSQNTVASG